MAAPPLDGVRAYSVAFGVAFLQMTVLGTYTCYPVYNNLLHNDEGLGRPSLTTLASAESIVLGIIPTVGVGMGIGCDKFGPTWVVLLSSLCIAGVGLLTPFAQSIEAFLGIYSTFMGIACACIVAPGPATLGTWFSGEKVSIGMGIGEAGSAIGTSILPVISGALVDQFGEWRIVFRYMSIVAVVPLLCAFVVKPRPGAEEGDGDAGDHEKGLLNGSGGGSGEAAQINNTMSVWGCIRTPQFIGLFVGQLLFAFAYFSVLYIGIPFARRFGTAGTTYAGYPLIGLEAASTLLTFFGAANAAGAVLLGLLASKLNNRLVFSVAMAVLGILFSLWTVADQWWQLAILFFLMGFACAGGLACLPSMVVETFMGPNLNTLMSLSFVGFGVGGLCGPPISSALVTSDGSFTYSIVVIAFAVVIASGSVFVLMGLPAHHFHGTPELPEDEQHAAQGHAINH